MAQTTESGFILTEAVYSDIEFVIPAQTYRRNGLSVDTGRKTKPKRIYANKKLLVRCDYFQAMFGSGFREEHGVVDEVSDDAAYIIAMLTSHTRTTATTILTRCPIRTWRMRHRTTLQPPQMTSRRPQAADLGPRQISPCHLRRESQHRLAIPIKLVVRVPLARWKLRKVRPLKARQAMQTLLSKRREYLNHQVSERCRQSFPLRRDHRQVDQSLAQRRAKL